MPVTPNDDETDVTPPPPPPPSSLADSVRQSPIGAVIGAFVAGFLLSRLI